MLFGLFGLILLILTGSFLAAHYILHIGPLVGVRATPLLFISLVPHIFLYTVPISIFLTLGFFYDYICSNSTYILLASLKQTTELVKKIIAIFLISAICLFAITSFYAGPKFYITAKEQLTYSFVETVRDMPTHQLHTITDRSALYFESKYFEKNYIQLDHIFLVLNKLVISANRALIEERDGEHMFFFFDGTILDTSGKTIMRHQFKKLSLSVASYAQLGAIRADNPKYLTLNKLFFMIYAGPAGDKNTAEKKRYIIELVKRVYQTIWLLFFPFLFLLFFRVHPEQKVSRKNRVALISGLLFIGYYFFTTVFSSFTAALLYHNSFLLGVILSLGLLITPGILLAYFYRVHNLQIWGI